jgi:hypothetical protein
VPDQKGPVEIDTDLMMRNLGAQEPVISEM